MASKVKKSKKRKIRNLHSLNAKQRKSAGPMKDKKKQQNKDACSCKEYFCTMNIETDEVLD